MNTTIYSCRIIMPGHALINANLYRQRLQSNGTRVTSINGASTAEAFRWLWRYETKLPINTSCNRYHHTRSTSCKCNISVVLLDYLKTVQDKWKQIKWEIISQFRNSFVLLYNNLQPWCILSTKRRKHDEAEVPSLFLSAPSFQKYPLNNIHNSHLARALLPGLDNSDGKSMLRWCWIRARGLEGLVGLAEASYKEKMSEERNGNWVL